MEVNDLTFMAWEDSETGTMIVNPTTRFGLDELDEIGRQRPGQFYTCHLH